jgi:drug/metabolite transporter (DMT)-like permease
MRAFRQLPGTIRGAVWMILGGTSLVLLAVTIRELEGRYGVLQMIFMRSVISLILILPWVLKQKREEIKTRRLGLHLFRNTVHYLGNVGWFLGVTLVPLADLSALQFTVPLFTICFAAVVLPEKVGTHRWIATAIGFAGALVVIRPGFIALDLGTVAVIASAVCYAASQVSTKSLSETDTPNAILFYMSIIFIPVSAIPAAIDWIAPTWGDAIPIFLLGLFGYLAHACIIRSFAAADASFVMPFDFIRLPIAAIIGFLLYTEQPDLWVWLGAIIIFGATYYNTRRESLRF